jgi:hypothetical protein
MSWPSGDFSRAYARDHRSGSGDATVPGRITGQEGAVNRGFFESLFDFSFSDFIATRLVKAIYGISIFVAGLIALFTLIGGLSSRNGGTKLAGLILAPVGFLLTVIWVRLVLELMIVVFRIADHTRDTAARIADIGPHIGTNGISPDPAQEVRRARPVVRGGESAGGAARASPAERFLAGDLGDSPTEAHPSGSEQTERPADDSYGETVDAEAAARFCTQCGAKVAPGQRFCSKCGTALE